MAKFIEPDARIIHISKEFYAELSRALLIEERWFDKADDDGGFGLVLYAMCHGDGTSRKLVFTRDK